jgi:hypothetical protein
LAGNSHWSALFRKVFIAEQVGRYQFSLEDAATEFQVQGLELDWTIVTWDADLRWSGDDWSYHSFRGAQKMKSAGPT